MFEILEKNQCDHGHSTTEQVRLLPYGGGGNLIVCKHHYQKEIAERGDENLPKWEDLKIYEAI